MKRKPVHGSTRATTPSTEDLELDARRQQRLHTAATLKTARTPLAVIQLAADATELAEATTRAARTRVPPSTASACQEGCAWCCYKRVGVAAPEVLRIAAYMERLPPADRQQLIEQIQQGYEDRQRLRHDRSAANRLPCPLLVQNRCAVYPVRPLTCRGFNSSNAQACADSLERRVAVPVYEPQLRVATFVLDGVRAGVTEAGLAGDLLELTSALQTALTVPQTAERWLAGEAVLASARLI